MKSRKEAKELMNTAHKVDKIYQSIKRADSAAGGNGQLHMEEVAEVLGADRVRQLAAEVSDALVRQLNELGYATDLQLAFVTERQVSEASLDSCVKRITSLSPTKVAISVTEPPITPAGLGYEWNRPDRLAPVGCELLLRLPDGKVVTAFRTKHLAEKGGAMEYRLPNDELITGRFEWTYP